jgi:GAF domain-containing protein
MLAEVEQEMRKLDHQVHVLEREFNGLVAAGDPITIEDTRAQMRTTGQKWDALRARQNEIEVVLRQKRLDRRMVALGRRFGIEDLVGVLRFFRIVLLAVSVVAALLALTPGLINGTTQTLDTINGICSLVLTSEFAFRLALVTGRRQYLVSRAFDIFLSLPHIWLAGGLSELQNLARLIALLRIGRLVRLVTGERRQPVQGFEFLRAREFVLLRRVLFLGVFVVALGAAALQYLEGRGTSTAFASFSNNLWWGIKVVLTSELSDDPQTTLGRVLTIGIILVGVSLTSILIATITAVLVNLSSESSDSERQQDDISQKLSAVRTQLDLLTNARRDAAQTAAHISYSLVNTQQPYHLALEDATQMLVRDFGCLQASIHLINESTREATRITVAGNPQFAPEERIAFDTGLVGRAASVARRGTMGALPEYESEPLPLADGVALGIPLFVRSQVRSAWRVYGLGVLHLVVPQAWARDEVIRLLLTDVSGSLAQFLYSYEVTAGQQELLDSISDLQTTMEAVTTTLDYQRLLFEIARGANALLNTEMSKVMLVAYEAPEGANQVDTGILRGVAWHGMPDELGKNLFTRIGEGLSGICARTGNPVKSSNLLSDQRVNATSSQALRSGMRSELCVPIRARGVLLGVLSVMSKSHKRFTQEEEYLLGTLAGQAGAAIENARIYAREQHRLKIAEAMQAISQRLSESTDERATLGWILEQMPLVIQHDSASILLVEHDMLRMAAYTGFGPETMVENISFPISRHELFNEIASTRQSILVADTRERPEWLAGPTEIRSWIGVPLIVEERIIGLLGIDCQQPNALTVGDVAVAERFAVQAALAVRTARLYSALRDCETDMPFARDL